MPEILSQQEIDQLLNNIKSGTEQSIETSHEREAVLFDFRLPNRISKNQLRILRSFFENFAESFSSFLVTKLQTVVNINVTSVDQIYYSEYVLSVANPACLFTFDIRNTDVKGILELNNDLALSLVDKLLGGNGLGTKQSKVITPIEQRVLRVVVERIMQDLRKAWQTWTTSNLILNVLNRILILHRSRHRANRYCSYPSKFDWRTIIFDEYLFCNFCLRQHTGKIIHNKTFINQSNKIFRHFRKKK